MNLDQITTECFVLALFIRDDGRRFLLGSGAYVFKDSQQHFAANSYANDVVEVQGNDGVFLAGQVRRASSQSFDGYIGDATVHKPEIEGYRRDFIAFFRKNHYYKVVYVFPNGEAIQRRKGFIVDAPEVKELYQLYPEYHIALNFEDINYYSYSEDAAGGETYTKSATIYLSSGGTSGGLIWDGVGAQCLAYGMTDPITVNGTNITINNELNVNIGISNIKLSGDLTQSGTPTPDNPQPITTVSGQQTVTINGTPYTIDLGSIELCKVGNFQDYIYNNGDGWYLHQEVRHLSLAVADMNNVPDYPGWTNLDVMYNDLGSGYNTALADVTSQINNYIATADSPRINTAVQKTIFMRANNWPYLNQAQWQSTYPDLVCEIYYGILNPLNDIPITDPTLLQQLNVLSDLRLEVGTNTISMTSSSLAASLEFTYYTGIDYDGAGFAWEAGSGGGPTTVMVDSIDRVYPIWEISGPATNPQLSVLTTGTTLRYNGTVSASQTLTIDMFNKTAKLNGASVIGNITGDWAYFEPGNNRVTYTTNNADADPSTIYWQEVIG